MVDRIDLWSGALFFGAGVAPLILVVLLFPGVISQNNQEVFLILLAISLSVYIYPLYWALDIRRALAVHLYRNQALGIGLVSISFMAAEIDPTGTAYGIAVIVAFYWIDASVIAGRRTDPLLRDTLHWSRLRYGLWALLVISYVPEFVNIVLTRNPYYTPSNSVFGALAVAGFLVAPVSGIVVLPLVAKRSRDPAFRRHVAWFGLSVAMPFAGIIIGSVHDFYALQYFVSFALQGFFMYKSARSLVPLNKISLIELTSPLSKETSFRPVTSLGNFLPMRRRFWVGT
jgi:hypothetical protein